MTRPGFPLTLMTPGALTGTVRLGIVDPPGGAADREWGTGGARLLFSDSRVVVLLLGEARRRAIVRMFGVPMDQTGLVSLIAAATLAGAVHDKAVQVLQAPGVPSLGGVVFAGNTAKEAVHLVAGEWSRDVPLFGPLVAFAVAGTFLRPVLKVSFRDVKEASQRTRVAFDRRYGHLVRRNRPHSPMPR